MVSEVPLTQLMSSDRAYSILHAGSFTRKYSAGKLGQLP
jgi:hypothetical protein